ncbi:MAG: DEAD/DEAH box helicase [Lachnospiraceae bacterium]|nr:DEAD/DEAH box helicase [Lachnospiraceae bacterium]
MARITREELKQAKQTVKWARLTRDRLISVASRKSIYEGEIHELYNRLLGYKVAYLMKDIPVERLNDRKEGIKTDLLINAGLTSVRDVYNTPPTALMRINGIGEATVLKIENNIKRIYDDLMMTTNITLEDASDSPEWREIFNHMDFLIKNRSRCEEAQYLLDQYGLVFEEHIPVAERCTNFFTWMFTPGAKKDETMESVVALQSVYASGIQEQLAIIDDGFSTASANGAGTYQDFKKNPISYHAYWDQIFGENKTGLDTQLDEFARGILELKLDTRGLNAILRGYQVYGTKYILSQKMSLLGDEMGLGKTMQALAAMVHLYNQGSKHFLVFCPLSVVENWRREVTRFTPLRPVIFHGSQAICEAAWNDWYDNGGVGIANYSSAYKLEPLKDTPIALMVVDEAHYIKNPEAQRTKMVLSMGGWAERVVYMTGTPLENKVDEMLYMIECLNSDVAKEIRRSRATSDAPSFKKIIMPVYLRRERADVLTELPEKIEYKDWLLPNETELKWYVERLTESGNPFMSIRRISWGIDDITQSTKANRLMEIVEEARDDGKRLLIFTFFKDTLAKVKLLLGDKCIGTIDGSTPSEERQAAVDKLGSAAPGSALVAQIVAGGTGLNIQAASVVVFCEPQIKPSLEDQALSRSYRMGQTDKVIVHWLLCAQTVDEQIMSILDEKRKLFNDFAADSDAANLDDIFTSDEISRIVEQERATYVTKTGE